MGIEIKFNCLVTNNKSEVIYDFTEWLDGDGWKHDYYSPLVTNGVFDHQELGDGFLGEIERRRFTGLKDKNNVEVYEGDIVLANGYESVLVHDFSEARKFVSKTITDIRKFELRRSAYKVYWQQSFLQFSFMSLSNPKHSINADVNERYIEVVGNIFMNPELITNP